MPIFHLPVFAATLALLVVAYVAFGISGVVGIAATAFLLRNF